MDEERWVEEPGSANDFMHDGAFQVIHHSSLIWYQAGRRDALLMLLLAGGILMWGWDRGTLVALGSSVASGGLFLLLLLHLRQSRRALSQLAGYPIPWDIRRYGHWATGIAILGALPAALLVGKVAWQMLPSHNLAMILALLTFCWQVWLYFWTAEPPDTSHEE